MSDEAARRSLRSASATSDLDASTGRGRGIHFASAAVLAAGIVLTVALAAATQSANNSNEDRLLQQRTREAAAVLIAAIPSIQTPIAAAAEVAEQSDGDPAVFQRLMTPVVDSQRFISASLWRVDDASSGPFVTVGDSPKLTVQPASTIQGFVDRSVANPGLSVVGLLDGDDPRLGYSYTTSVGSVRFIAYAEAALPADRTSVVRSGTAFSELDHAIYLGDDEDPATLLTASTPELPMSGRRASDSVEFGDTSLLLVMSPTGQLGGGLLEVLPWLVAAVGALTTVGAALLIERLARRRDHADELAARNHLLYTQQRSVARLLQESLLPQRLPDVPGLEVAARYVPGVAELDIGGDWYDIIELDEHHVLLVVGDVSGRGLPAGTLMASLRFSIRAFASRGDPPDAILTGLTRLIDLDHDGHFATVLCCAINTVDGTVSIANAGHPNPLLSHQGDVHYLTTHVGPPIGVTREARYETAVHRIPQGAILLGFTDGLFERRGESIDVGLERLRGSVPLDTATVAEVLNGTLDAQIAPDSHDDSAIIGVRWTTTSTP